jgi:glyoxylase-like metal-dependent hydrolase (beta-lactamase superfamily II)
MMTTAIANLFFRRNTPGQARGWTLVDAGFGPCAGRSQRAAEDYFGLGAKPDAIVLTHAHFDHVGALKDLAEMWDVPIYAHPQELPYLTGRAKYPPPDPSVEGGAMARLSFLYPRGAPDVSNRVQPLPDDGSVPTMEGWKWIHTPRPHARPRQFVARVRLHAAGGRCLRNGQTGIVGGRPGAKA